MIGRYKFLNKSKNDAKRNVKSHVFWYKIATWASQVRHILWFLKFWCDAKTCFCSAKSIYGFLNRSLEQPRVARGTSTHGFGGSGVPGRRPIIKQIDETMIEATRCKVWHAVRPLARRIYIIYNMNMKLNYVYMYLIYYMILYYIISYSYICLLYVFV